MGQLKWLSHVAFQLFPLQKTDRIITFLANKDILKLGKELFMNEFSCQLLHTTYTK